MNLRVEALDDRHDLASFSCGNLELDRWLRDHARQATAQGTRTYVVLDEDEAVVGYFAIAPHVLDRGDAPPKLGRGAPRQIPSILLAKLALSEQRHGQGLGSELLVRALGTIIDAARVGGRQARRGRRDRCRRRSVLRSSRFPAPPESIGPPRDEAQHRSTRARQGLAVSATSGLGDAARD